MILQIECGQDHTLFVMESGEVFACGMSSDGQTGKKIVHIMRMSKRYCYPFARCGLAFTVHLYLSVICMNCYCLCTSKQKYLSAVAN